jgi:hypothetical protein
MELQITNLCKKKFWETLTCNFINHDCWRY